MRWALPCFPAERHHETMVLKMGIYIHREASFKKSLDTLAKGDKTAARAAARAEEIMARLASGDSQAIEVVSRRTKHGELRINGCRKYSLGGGYRLVFVKRGSHLVATYVGSHDDCNRWIENNRGFEPELPSHSSAPFPSENQESESPRDSEVEEREPDYDDTLMKQIDEKMLRRIFTGLCGES